MEGSSFKTAAMIPSSGKLGAPIVPLDIFCRLAARPPKNEHCIPQVDGLVSREVSIHCSKGHFVRFRKCPSISKQVVPQGHGNHRNIPQLCVHFIIHLSSFRIITLEYTRHPMVVSYVLLLFLWGGIFT